MNIYLEDVVIMKQYNLLHIMKNILTETKYDFPIIWQIKSLSLPQSIDSPIYRRV